MEITGTGVNIIPITLIAHSNCYLVTFLLYANLKTQCAVLLEIHS